MLPETNTASDKMYSRVYINPNSVMMMMTVVIWYNNKQILKGHWLYTQTSSSSQTSDKWTEVYVSRFHWSGNSVRRSPITRRWPSGRWLRPCPRLPWSRAANLPENIARRVWRSATRDQIQPGHSRREELQGIIRMLHMLYAVLLGTSSNGATEEGACWVWEREMGFIVV